MDAPRVVQPPYAPELNPVARFFRELRRALEGRVHSDPAGPTGRAGADPEGVAGGSGTGAAAVRLALDPEGPNRSARRHTSNLIILDWYETGERHKWKAQGALQSAVKVYFAPCAVCLHPNLFNPASMPPLLPGDAPPLCMTTPSATSSS